MTVENNEPTHLVNCERVLRALADHLALGCGDNGHNADNHFIGFRHVGGDELDARLLQSKQDAASRESRSSLAMTSTAP